MSFVAAHTCTSLRLAGTGWQDGYYDTLIRTPKQFAYVEYYIEQNPVVKGLVEEPQQWKASSAYRTNLVTNPWPCRFD